MPLYVADYKADTAHLSCAEHGAYLLLIMHYWQRGSLPDDDSRLAKIASASPSQWAQMKPVIAEFFKPGWVHERVAKELSEAKRISESRSQAGKNGARAKWGDGVGSTTRSERLASARKIACHSSEEWSAMQELFGGCVKCGAKLSDLHGDACTKDHIVPIYKGGSDGIENIQPLCRQCNASKSGDETDYRETRIKDWRGLMAKRMANACLSHPQPLLVGNLRDSGSGKILDLCPKPASPVRTRNQYPDDFLKFWGDYPTDANMSKAEAAKAWARLPDDDRQLATKSVGAFRAYCASHPDYRPVHANRYLTQRRFEGHGQIAERSATVSVVVKQGTAQGAAWERHTRQTKSKGVPWTNGVWRFPSEWPPESQTADRAFARETIG
jgi:uncharacterized protein YdaU (DUF1376 family)